MSALDSRITVAFSGTLTLSEAELRVLDAMAGYGTEAFLEAFYKHLGRSYMKPYEGGIRELFDSIKKSVPAQLAKVDEARRLLHMRPAQP